MFVFVFSLNPLVFFCFFEASGWGFVSFGFLYSVGVFFLGRVITCVCVCVF